MTGSVRLPTFWLKVLLIAGLVAWADWLVFDVQREPGLSIALLLLGWTIALPLGNRAVFANRLGRVAFAAAAVFALVQVERPTFVGMGLFVIAVGVAALSPRAGGGDVWSWAQRLAAGGALTFIGPFLDLARLRRALKRRGRLRIAAIASAVMLPVVGGAVFLALFAQANPLIGEALAAVRLPPIYLGRIAFWAVAAVPVAALLRPRGLSRTIGLPALGPDAEIPGGGVASIAASLVVFNLLFALQNGLDITYLWADARLPGTLTFAQYAHSGAYVLIATALLAGLFVVGFLRPGSRTAEHPWIRALVLLWVAQNVLLVAGAALRLLIYIDVYSLTRTRIAALIWMALVASGLALIAWRLIAHRSTAWLLGANALAVGLALSTCAFVDLGGIAADWNVRHAREVGGRGQPLDLCYLRTLHGAAVLPLAGIEFGNYDPAFLDRVKFTRRLLMGQMATPLSTWRSWRFRDARRLSGARLAIYERPMMVDIHSRDCQGRPLPPPPAPLTPTPNPGTR
jgi:hypothetical protein